MRLHSRVKRAIQVAGVWALCGVWLTVPVKADDFHAVKAILLSQPSVDNRKLPQITDAIRSSKGGLLLAGAQDLTHAWLSHIGNDLTVDWSETHDQGWPVYGADALVDADDGGFWAVGYGRSRDTQDEERKSLRPSPEVTLPVTFDFIARFDANGKRLWQRSFFEGNPRFFECARDAKDGVIVLARATRDYPDSANPGKVHQVTVPWLAKFDEAGNIVWQRTLPDGPKPVVTTMFRNFDLPCNALQISTDGRVTVAVTVKVITDVRETHGELSLPEDYYENMNAPGSLVVQLDKHGRQLHMFTTQGADGEFLFAAPEGFSLVEHMRPGPPKRSSALGLAGIFLDGINIINSTGVRIISLDNSLRSLVTREIKVPAFSADLLAVEPVRGGGYFVAGCDHNANNYIARTRPDGSIGKLQLILQPSEAGACAHIGLSEDSPSGALLVFYGTPRAGNRLMRVDTNAQ